MIKSIINEIISITTAIAVASEYWYCSSFVIIKSGVISVFIGMLPEMNTTEPYSPTALAKAREKPVSHAGKIIGIMTLTNV